MSTPYSSSIPYPSSTGRRDSESGRRGSIGGGGGMAALERRGSVAGMIAAERRGSTAGLALIGGSLNSSDNRGDTHYRRNSMGHRVEFATHQDGAPPQRVNEFDLDLQHLKLRDQRRFSGSATFEDANGAAFSPYLNYRTQRVLEEYAAHKLDEKKFLNNLNQYDRDMLSGSTNLVPTSSYGIQNQQQQGRRNLLPYSSDNGFFGEYLHHTNSNVYTNGPVELVEWFPRENGREHRTDKFSTVNMMPPFRSNPVFRRGQPFFVAMKLATATRSSDFNRQNLTFVFNFGSSTSCGKQTRIILPISEERFSQDKNEWNLRLHSVEGSHVTVEVMIPASAPVGVWQYEIHYNNEVIYGREDIYVLFNPYCSEDSVFVDNEQYRREYVHSESGKLYRGTNKTLKSSKWVYGQFEPNVLALTCLLLDRYTEGNKDVIDFNQRGNPAFVARALAKMMFSRFSGPFRNTSMHNGDTAQFKSFSYTGSQAVLDRFVENRFQPLDIDNQSYIVSGLYVTFCRALGIPCRSVTTYRAPMDKTTLNVDQYWGNPEEDTSGSDLYQAYHCFNDVCIRRDDIQTGSSFIGWQAIDAYNVGRGPAPAEAIRRGETGVNYDVFHFYSMFNSHIRQHFGNLYSGCSMRDDIGRLIVTKKCDRDDDDEDFEDITHLYRKIEGSDDERQGVFNALRGSRRHSVRNQEMSLSPDFRAMDDFSAEWVYNSASYGQNMQVSLALQNITNESRTLTIGFFARPVYGGVLGRKLKQVKRQVTLQPLQRETLGFDLNCQDYQDRLDDDYIIRFYATIYCKETQQFWAGDEDMSLNIPKINIQSRGHLQVDSESQMNFTMVNPLTYSLTDCYIFYEAPGMSKPVYRRLPDVKPGEMLNINEHIVPRKAGDSRLVVTFNSRQLRQVSGSKVFSVRG